MFVLNFIQEKWNWLIKTNDDIVQWCIYAALWRDELTKMFDTIFISYGTTRL